MILFFILFLNNFLGSLFFVNAEPFRNSEEVKTDTSKNNLKWEYIPRVESEEQEIIWEELKNERNFNFNEKSNFDKKEITFEVRAIGRAVTVNGNIFPEISNYVPNAFVEDWRKSFTTSFRGISCTRHSPGKNFSSDCSDGVLDFDFNLVNRENFSFNPKINIQSLTNRGSNFGEGISVGFKTAKKLSNKWSVAFGGENIIHLDKTVDLGRNFYLVASTYQPIFKRAKENSPLIFINAGLGTDFYGYKGNGYLGQVNCFGKPNLTGEDTNLCNVGPIGSFAIAFNDRVAFINEWFGYGYGSGFSIKPFLDQSILFSIYATDYLDSFPKYLKDGCPNKECKTRFYGSLSITF